ncbi:c-type cytochrome [Aquihabitans daechungensis]|uniref:c-type cytochrome n=1 Tax=Aquihabitans daechungensis TaxID=1052257 RepID=UPI003BA2E5BA
MTEIPEHLLKKAAAARAAKAGGEAPADDAAPAAGDAPAAAAADAPAAVEKPKAAPAPLPTLDEAEAAPVVDIPVVAAAKARKRIPFWAASVLAILPLWGVIYVFSVQPPPAGESDPFVIGREVYVANCAGCHLPSGAGSASGGTGQQLNEGRTLETFEDPLAQVYWEHFGTEGGARPDGTYGDGTQRNINDLSNNMGAFDTLSPEEMAAVVIYVREELNEGTPEDDPNFNSELFREDPEAMAALVEAVAALDPNDPDAVADLDGAESN